MDGSRTCGDAWPRFDDRSRREIRDEDDEKEGLDRIQARRSRAIREGQAVNRHSTVTITPEMIDAASVPAFPQWLGPRERKLVEEICATRDPSKAPVQVIGGVRHLRHDWLHLRMSTLAWVWLLRDAPRLAAWLRFERRAAMSFFGADLRHADLSGVNLVKVDFTEAQLDDASFENARVFRALFNDAEMDGVAMRGAMIGEAVFDRASLRCADFKRAVMGGTSFQRCDLRGAIFDNAHFADVSFEGALRDVDDSPLMGWRVEAPTGYPTGRLRRQVAP